MPHYPHARRGPGMTARIRHRERHQEDMGDGMSTEQEKKIEALAEWLHVSHKAHPVKPSCKGCAAQAIRLLDSGVDVTVPPEPKYEPGQVVRLRLEDGMPYLAKRVDSNDGWEVFGVDVVITDDEVTDVEPVAVLTAEDVRELRKNRGISNFARFFRERGLDL